MLYICNRRSRVSSGRFLIILFVIPSGPGNRLSFYSLIAVNSSSFIRFTFISEFVFNLDFLFFGFFLVMFECISVVLVAGGILEKSSERVCVVVWLGLPLIYPNFIPYLFKWSFWNNCRYVVFPCFLFAGKNCTPGKGFCFFLNFISYVYCYVF